MRITALYTVIIFLLAACKTTSAVVESQDKNENSAQKRAAQSAVSQGMASAIWLDHEVYPILDDQKHRAIYDRVRRMRSRITKQGEKRTTQIWIVNTDDHNAWTLPDGSLYLTSGLLQTVSNDDQLAGVILLEEISWAKELRWNHLSDQLELSQLAKCCKEDSPITDQILSYYIYGTVAKTDDLLPRAQEQLCAAGYTDKHLSSLLTNLESAQSIYSSVYSTASLIQSTEHCDRKKDSDEYAYAKKALYISPADIANNTDKRIDAKERVSPTNTDLMADPNEKKRGGN